MASGLPACASRALLPLFALAGAFALAACNPDGTASLNPTQPRGATVAFDSIDGLPPAQFGKLVENLNAEAQTRRLAVTSRETPSAYRVRGYLAADVAKRESTVSWVWDVFDREEHRALRIAGKESVKDRHHRGWAVADDAMLRRIAAASMDELAAFLTSPAVAPGTPAPAASGPEQVALVGERDSSPEAAGIFRIFKPQADPRPDEESAPAPQAAAVPLPRPRPSVATVSARTTLALAAPGR
jgi:hypothetical protein